MTDPIVTRRHFFSALWRQGVGWIQRAARAYGGAALPGPGPKSGPRDPAARPIRPPGALPEATFLKACTQCEECVRACPEQAILRAGPEAGKAAGFPMLRPATTACVYCVGLPCIAACGDGALVAPPGVTRPPIGTALVDAAACVSTRGEDCRVCAQVCAESPNAVSVRAGAPAAIDPWICTGCGACARDCPAGAIRIQAPAGRFAF